jgi:hypothetical protein
MSRIIIVMSTSIMADCLTQAQSFGSEMNVTIPEFLNVLDTELYSRYRL